MALIGANWRSPILSNRQILALKNWRQNWRQKIGANILAPRGAKNVGSRMGGANFRFGAKYFRAITSIRQNLAPKTVLAPKIVAPKGVLAPVFIFGARVWRQKWFLAPKNEKLAPKSRHLGSWPFYPIHRQFGAKIAPKWRQFGGCAQPPTFGANWRQFSKKTWKIAYSLESFGAIWRRLAAFGAKKLRTTRSSILPV